MNYKLLVFEDNTGNIFLLKEALKNESFLYELTILNDGGSVIYYIGKVK